MTFALTRSLRSLRSGELVVLQPPAKPATGALTTFLLAPLAEPPSAAHVAGGHCSLALVALASLGLLA